ncbi:MAG: hypothetical protein NTZ48_04470, partial [Candidatus Omnitrophica bacterium]|nr:hypothetical protein [Candidatus Omnitrophota bacterium]
RLLLRGFGATVFLLPLFLLRCMGASGGRLFCRFSGRYRELARENLKIVFPGIEEDSLRTIIKDSFTMLGENGADSIWFISRNKKRRKQFVDIEGKEFLDAALSQGRGVIAATAHIGAFTILGGTLAAYGYRVNCILRTPRDEKMANVLGRGLRMQEVKPIFTYPAIKCVNDSIGALRRNEILVILIDQDMGRSGVFVNFFGRPASTPAGTLIFSLRTGASIVPMFIIRGKERHKLIIEKEFDLVYGESAEKSVLDNTQRLTYLIEGVIRKYPRQWSWVDRRWKTQPQNNTGIL